MKARLQSIQPSCSGLSYLEMRYHSALSQAFLRAFEALAYREKSICLAVILEHVRLVAQIRDEWGCNHAFPFKRPPRSMRFNLSSEESPILQKYETLPAYCQIACLANICQTFPLALIPGGFADNPSGDGEAACYIAPIGIPELAVLPITNGLMRLGQDG